LAVQRELLLDCGAGVRLQCFVSSPPAHASGPCGGAAARLGGERGLAVRTVVGATAVRAALACGAAQLRDHGDTHHLNRELFHSCRLPEVIGAVRALQQHFAGTALQLVGFSLGGNFMLRVAAQAREADSTSPG